jgi:membrane fusion protein, multidrug efflux system
MNRWMRILPLALLLGLPGPTRVWAAESVPAPSEVAATADADEQGEGLSLSAEQRQRLGIVSTPLLAAPDAAAPNALGLVLDPQPLFQLLSDLSSARAAEHASSAALTRTRALHAADGTASAQELEQAQATATQDQVRLRLLRRQLLSQWGGPLAADGNEQLADALAAGSRALLRIDSELGFGDARTPSAAYWQFDAEHPALELSPLWPAPSQDPASPGRGFLALAADAPGLRPGSRGSVQLRLPGTDGATLLLPRAALVMAQGRGYAYIEMADGHYQRRPVDLARAVQSGYLIDAGYAAGDLVVVHGAGLLLATELGSDAEDQD